MQQDMVKKLWYPVSVVAIVAVLGLLSYLETRHSAAQLRQQKFHAMSAAARTLENNLSASIARIHSLAMLFAREQSPLLDQLYLNPGNKSVKRQVREKVTAYFPDFFAFTLADINGNPMLEDELGQIGKGCRLDIAQFAQTNRTNVRHVYSPHIHFNRLGQGYGRHFDVMVPWVNAHRGVFFVSIRDDFIKQRMARYENPGYHLVLLNADNHYEVELLSSDKTSKKIPDKRRLDIMDPRSYYRAGRIPNTAWEVAGQIDNAALEQATDTIRDRNFLIASAVSLFAVIILSLLRHEVRRNQELRLLNDQYTREIEQHERTQTQLNKLINFDPLTGLPNKQSAHDFLGHSLALAKQEDFRPAVLFIDIDRFANLNDSLGHQTGDVLLKRMAQRLRKYVEASDMLARWGGDEFLVIVQHCPDQHQLGQYAQQLISVMEEPFNMRGGEVVANISIGIAVYPDAGNDQNSLIKNADLALRESKNTGKNRARFFIQQMNEHINQRLNLEADLRRAISENEFEPWYQPKLDLRTGQIAGAEVLMRWRHPEHGIMAPARFLDLIEENGLIEPIGEQVRNKICQHAGTWLDKKLPVGEIAVNLGGPEFGREDIVSNLEQGIKTCGLAPESFQIEITEGQLMKNTSESLGKLYGLKELGFSLAVDDFGTGYSSLAYLKRFPIDVLKIDRSFVSHCDQRKDDRDILQMILQLAHNLELIVVAEGVETTGQLEILKEMGCDQIQGYHFARPMPASEFEQFIGTYASQQIPA